MTNLNDAPPAVLAAARYAMDIRSRRDLLQTLYYAVKNSADEAWALHLQLQPFEPQFGLGAAPLGLAPLNGAPPLRPADVLPHHELQNAKRAAEATSQDAACAIMLLLDASLQRLRFGIEPLDQRDFGPEIAPSLKLNKARALANQARHGYEWIGKSDSELNLMGDVRVIQSLKHSPRNLNAAREVICGMNLNAYVTFESMMLETAHDVIAPTGWKLGMVAAGTYRLDRPPQPANPK